MATIPYMNWMGSQPSGSAYDVYQYYLGGGNAGGSSTPSSGGGGITSLPFYKQTGGGGGGQSGLGGRYGNLDLSKTKTFNKGVYEVGGPANQYGSFVDKEVKGYLNPTLGGYQTLEGKNINHAGINIQPMFASLLGLDKKGPQPGDIEGTFTKGFESGIGKIKEGWEEEKEKLGKVIGLKKNKAKKEKQVKEHQAAVLLAAQEKAAKEKAKADAAAAVGDGRYGRGSGGQKSHDFGTGFGTHATSGGPVSNRTGRGRTDYDDGGMVNDPEYRGWKKMYEANPEIGSMHKKHPSFIKFYKKHERDKKKFGGLAGLLYG